MKTTTIRLGDVDIRGRWPPKEERHAAEGELSERSVRQEGRPNRRIQPGNETQSEVSMRARPTLMIGGRPCGHKGMWFDVFNHYTPTSQTLVSVRYSPNQALDSSV